MKQLLFVLLPICLFIFSCSKPNYEYNKTEMSTISGETALLSDENVIIVPEAGIGCILTEPMITMAKEGTLEVFPVSNDCLKFVTYSKELLELVEVLDPLEMTEKQMQEFTIAMMQYVFEACAIIKINNEADQALSLSNYKTTYSNTEKIAKTDKFTYYFLHNDNSSVVALKDDELKTFADNIIVFNPVEN